MPAKKKSVPIDKSNTTATKRHDPPAYIDDTPFYGRRLDNEQLCFANAIWSKDIDIVFCNASSGCGKTFIATGVANMLVKYGLYEGIVYVMSPYADKVQGFLPGDIKEKSSVYFDAFMQSLIDCRVNLQTAINYGGLIEQDGEGYITCLTDTYMRGTNISNKVLILDEAQNMTVAQLKKILTRVKDGTKVIVIGHTKQCDLEDKSLSGFDRYINHFKVKPRCAVVELQTNHRGWISRVADEVD